MKTRSSLTFAAASPLLMILLACWGSQAAAADAASGEGVSFAREVRPILARVCYECHGPLDDSRATDLRLDRLSEAEGAKHGGKGTLVPGDPASSELYRRLVAKDELQRMPPPDSDRRLTPDEIERIRLWIVQGANMEGHWAFLPPEMPSVPRLRDEGGAPHPIDRFLLARLEREGISPAPEADRPALIRRVTFDLTGLPPTEQQIEAFVADDGPEAWERLVDRLLKSPHYGERWGRHWMDVWRYSDSDHTPERGRRIPPQMWRWRDWIVESLNRDLGYDRMLRQMIAADELNPTDQDALRATAWLARNRSSSRDTWLHDTVDHLGRGFLGLTIGCARCHDHPVDPITQEEYYRLRAIFEPLDVRSDPWLGGPRRSEKPELARAYDARLGASTYLYIRGNELTPDRDRIIEPGVPQILGGSFLPQTVDLPPQSWKVADKTYPRQSTGRRLVLARWLTDRRHPLTARVAVNHVWMRHFGRPLVETVDNLGIGGANPTHLELLDWLAVTFVEDGWSLKTLHRRIVTSAAYRRASTTDAENLARDPDNRLLGRRTARRLEAEAVRDAILQTAGRLDATMGGPPINPGQGLAVPRRSLYFTTSHSQQMEFLSTFDAAPVQECYRRPASIQPQQALALLNSPLAIHYARLMARELAPRHDDSAGQVEAAFRRVLGRPPDDMEQKACIEFLKNQAEELAAADAGGTSAADDLSRPSADPPLRALEHLVHVLLNHHEFVTVR